MKLVTFKVHTEERLGASTGSYVADLNSAYALYLKEIERKDLATRWASALIPPCMETFLAGGEEALEAARKTLNFLSEKDKNVVGLDGEAIFLKEEEIRLCAPIPRPGKLY